MNEALPPLGMPEPATSPEHLEFGYKLLTGHPRTDGSPKSSEALRMEYINLTDGLIFQMTDGLDVVNPQTKEHEKRVPDTVIFLDKSARPVSWLVKELWPRLAADPTTGAVPRMPDFKFLNIDREQWVNTVDPDGTGRMDINRVHPSIVRSLRSIFVDPSNKKEGLTEAIDSAPTLLDGKTVMVVDEVYSTGRTLNIATQFMRRAFPETAVGGAYWMQGTTNIGGAIGNADIPVWYKENDVYGRGVGNRQSNYPADRKHTNTQRLGSWFLSSRFPEPDQDALQLRREIHHLATEPDVPIRPSIERDDVFERLEALNGGMPAQQVLAAIAKVVGKPLGR